MRKNDVAEMLSLLDRQIELTMQYDRLTEHMVSADLETIQEVLINRSLILDDMSFNKIKINHLIEIQHDIVKEILQNIFKGNANEIKLTIEQKQIKQKVDFLMNASHELENKDGNIVCCLEQQLVNVKNELEDLKKDKKMIDYYHTIGSRTKGATFDSSM